MNAAVHTSTAQQIYFAFFSRPAPRVMGMRLPTLTGEEDDISIARRVIKETQEKMTRKYREVANQKRKEQKVNSGALVWVKREVNEPGVCKKLCQVERSIQSSGGIEKWWRLYSERPIYGTNVAKSG